MSATNEIPELDRKGLRNFGLTTGAIIAGLFGLFFPWLLDSTFPLWPWVILAVLGTWALIAPGSLGPVYRNWMRFGLLLNKITTPLIMGAVFFLVIVPFGFCFRLMGKDPLKRSYDDGATSYRIESTKPEIENLEKPF